MQNEREKIMNPVETYRNLKKIAARAKTNETRKTIEAAMVVVAQCIAEDACETADESPPLEDDPTETIGGAVL